MEIRMRSNVTRTAKGFAIEATLDISQDDSPRPGVEYPQWNPREVVAALSAFQVTELTKHMAALSIAFPREEGEKP